MKGKVVFILGCTPRSSTTATMKALSAHTMLHAPSMADLVLPNAPKWIRGGFEKIAPLAQSYFDNRWSPAIHATGFDKREAFDIAVMRQFTGEGVMGFTYHGLLNGQALPVFKTEHLDFLEKIVGRILREEPTKIPLIKYFGGIFLMDELKRRFPDAKFIFLQRHPEKAFTSYVTLLQSALKKEKLPANYWQGVYHMVKSAYQLAPRLVNDSAVLSLRSEDVSANMEKYIAIMLDYIGIPMDGQTAMHAELHTLKHKWQERETKGKGYEYSFEIARNLYNASDFPSM